MINKAGKIDHSRALEEWDGLFGLPDFSAFDDNDFAPAFETALKAAEAEIEALVALPDAPTVENFLIPYELSGKTLDRVCAVFFMRTGAHSNEKIHGLERDFAQKLSRFSSWLLTDERLFAKINALYQQLENVKPDDETRHVIEEGWKSFVRNGARLDEQGKKRLSELNERLAFLGAVFGQNILKDNVAWVLYLKKKEELAGLPDDLRNIMREAARERGCENAYAITLTRAIVGPFLTFSDHRDLRKAVMQAWSERGAKGGETDNRAIVAEMVRLRDEKAKLLGFDSYVALKLDNTMAKTSDHVMQLLLPIWERAKIKARAEKEELQRIAAKIGNNDTFMAWDWRYYAEKLKFERYAFDQAVLKPYLQLDQMIQAAFWVANRLFGLIFEEQKNVLLWHPEVRLWLVKNSDSSVRGLFIGDYFARSSKQAGAWMSALQSQHKLRGEVQPIIYIVTNFARPGTEQPALLSLDDACTLFHEFGHALHGLLSDVTWPSVSGTSVTRDFVELPSQLYEHWLTVPEVIEKFARHYRTGEAMPAELLKKILEAKTLNSGFETLQYTSSALVDMAFHSGEVINDPIQFEIDELARLGMPDAVSMMHRPLHFTHIFAGDSYSAGYYSYMWSEVLDVDAFSAFKESGDVFNRDLADKLKQYIYSSGGRADPAVLYKAFRGRLPSPEAMIKERGLDQ
ncbi:MAG: peptidyl-dipeptidase Dcp [Candidatus Tokpelaia sp. JSC189]|nr:MAG: peptidyl-dipeptidase Dcp [Candidatus Tokpelaia sp. JSC189]